MTTRDLLLTAALVLPVALSAQERWTSRNGNVSFSSSTPMENIEAKNNKVSSIYDASRGEVVFVVLIKSFEFEKALMQEHFNENYMESTEFPKASFKGKVGGIKPGDLSKPGSYAVTVTGDMTIHGVTKSVSTSGTFTADPTGRVEASCDFTIKPSDYGIKIPGMVKDNIAEDVKVQVRIDYTVN
ncbi:MAG: YceI family protein [Flavobacteriales bacterium]